MKMLFRFFAITMWSQLFIILLKWVIISSLFYIAKTKRHFSTGVDQHFDLTTRQPTEVADHVNGCIDCRQGSLKSVMKKCNSDNDCKVQEALLIQKLNMNSINNYLIKWSFIQFIKICLSYVTHLVNLSKVGASLP